MTNNNPVSKFYWKDWRNDSNLRLCSFAAKGLWMDMLSIMAESDHPGHLRVAGQPLGNLDIARATGGDPEEVRLLISELERRGVFSRDKDGTIISRRMTREESRRKKARRNGMKGGNPALKKAQRGDAASRWKQTQITGSVNPPLKPPDKGGVNSGVPPPIPLNHSTTTTTTPRRASADDPCAAVIEAFDDARTAAFGEHMRRAWPAQADRHTAQAWLNAGADIATLKAVFAETMGRKFASGPDDPPGVLAYCDAAVRKAIRSRSNGTGGALGFDTYGMTPDELREAADEFHREKGYWPNWGPQSNSSDSS